MSFIFRIIELLTGFFQSRTYSSSEIPVGKGLGRVSRKTMSGPFRSAVVNDARRLHKVGAASKSTSLGKGGGQRRRTFVGIKSATLSKWMAIASFSAIVLVGAGLIFIAATSGRSATVAASTDGKSMAEPEADSSGAITLEDTGSSLTISIGGLIKLQDEIISAAKVSDKFEFNNYLSELSGIMTADISIAGLVGSVDKTRGAAGFPNPNYPPGLISSLKSNGINMISNSNAKSLDSGYDSLVKTNRELSDNGIIAVGTSVEPDDPDLEVAQVFGGLSFVHEVNAIKVGIGSYYCPDSGELSSVKSAQASAGVTEIKQSCVHQLDIKTAHDYILDDVAAMRESGAQFIILYINWGTEGSTEPSSAQRDLAQKLIDAGVDVTVGAGPNVVQRITKKASVSTGKDCYVFYSIGNLFTDVNSGSDVKTQQSLVLSFTLTRPAGSNQVTLEAAKYHPVYCNRDKTYESENTYLKYRVVPAARYVDAPVRPDVFTTDEQWTRCKSTFTAMRNLVGDKLILGDVSKAGEETAEGGDSGNGEPATV